MLPASASVADRFQMARDAGFEEVECGTTPEQSMAEELLAGSKKSGLRIHSVMNMAHWKYPLSSSDPAVVAKSVKGMETSLHNAKDWGAETVLLVPAVVNRKNRLSRGVGAIAKQIRKMIPLAAELKVVIGIEEVWNHFLLSPMEFAKYVDEFKSPWVKAYFDVGNVVLFSFPQDWIRILGPRIVKVHLKDFRFRPVKGTGKIEAEFVNLQEGDIDWKQIHAALGEIGYKGTATVELREGDADYLKDVNAARRDSERSLGTESPVMKKFLLGVLCGAVLVILCGIILTFSAIRLSDRRPMIADNSVLVLRLEGEIPERAPLDIPLPMIEDQSRSTVRDIWSGLKRAAEDSRIKAVIVVPRRVAAGWAKTEEIRNSLASFKKSGKPVYAFLRFPGTKDYYIASVADKIYAGPEDYWISRACASRRCTCAGP